MVDAFGEVFISKFCSGEGFLFGEGEEGVELGLEEFRAFEGLGGELEARYFFSAELGGGFGEGHLVLFSGAA